VNGDQFHGTRATLKGADPFHIVQERNEATHDFIGSPISKGDVVHVVVALAPKPTGQTIALFDRG